MLIKRKLAMTFLSVLGALLLLGIISLFPVFSLEKKGMKTLQGNFVTVYYEAEERAARDVFALAEAESEQIAHKLAFSEPQPIRLYIYDKQSTFQTKKYGFITLLLGLDWYVGDNRGTNVLLTSPANPGPAHDYADVKATSMHEVVHAYNSLVNSRMSLWFNEGVALYLTNGSANRHFYREGSAPSISQTRTGNPLVFSQMGGYTFAYTYIEYLDRTYGWDKIMTYLKTLDFVEAFGVGEQEIYNSWIEFLQANYH